MTSAGTRAKAKTKSTSAAPIGSHVRHPVGPDRRVVGGLDRHPDGRVELGQPLGVHLLSPPATAEREWGDVSGLPIADRRLGVVPRVHHVLAGDTELHHHRHGEHRHCERAEQELLRPTVAVQERDVVGEAEQLEHDDAGDRSEHHRCEDLSERHQRGERLRVDERGVE